MAAFACAGCGRALRVDPARLDKARCPSCKTAVDASAHPVDVSDEQLANLVRTSPVPVLVDFWAEWCPPCRMLGPVVTELAKRHAGELIVVKVDTERHQQTAGQLGVSGIPALFVYKDGRVVANQAGAAPIHALEKFISPHLA